MLFIIIVRIASVSESAFDASISPTKLTRAFSLSTGALFSFSRSLISNGKVKGQDYVRYLGLPWHCRSFLAAWLTRSCLTAGGPGPLCRKELN